MSPGFGATRSGSGLSLFECGLGGQSSAGLSVPGAGKALTRSAQVTTLPE